MIDFIVGVLKFLIYLIDEDFLGIIYKCLKFFFYYLWKFFKDLFVFCIVELVKCFKLVNVSWESIFGNIYVNMFVMFNKNIL